MFKKLLLAVGILFFAFPSFSKVDAASQNIKQVYEWREYDVNENQDIMLDSFLKNSFIPAYNRLGVKIGVFKDLKNESVNKRYIFLIYPNLDSFEKAKAEIFRDHTFNKSAQSFFDKTAVSPAYSNISTYLLQAFDKLPIMRSPDKNRKLFEVRFYRSNNENANQRKINMFNDIQMKLSDQAGLHYSWFGEVLAGARMPSMMYMLWYKDEAERDVAWKKFFANPEFHRVRVLPEYANTATDFSSYLLAPMDYSQI